MDKEGILRIIGVWLLFIATIIFCATIGDMVVFVTMISVPLVISVLVFAIHITYEAI